MLSLFSLFLYGVPSIFLLSFLLSLRLWKPIKGSVHDGDTFQARRLFVTYKVRLWGVDAPEIDQPFGDVAKAKLVKLLRCRRVKLVVKGWHRERMVADVLVWKWVWWRSVGGYLLLSGLATYEPQYAPSAYMYRTYEAVAKLLRRGQWSQKKVVSPSAWRRGEKGRG